MINSPNKPDYRCQFDGCEEEGSWGFHGRFYCTAHKHKGEGLMAAISEGASTQFANPNAEVPAEPVTPKQGRLL